MLPKFIFPLCGTALALELTPSIFDSLQAKRQADDVVKKNFFVVL
jgi:hypothetical protein